MGILIRGGRVVDAAAQIDKIADVYLDDGVIQKVGEKLEAKDKDDKIIDAKGLVVMPGLVDLHGYFRDPDSLEKGIYLNSDQKIEVRLSRLLPSPACKGLLS